MDDKELEKTLRKSRDAVKTCKQKKPQPINNLLPTTEQRQRLQSRARTTVQRTAQQTNMQKAMKQAAQQAARRMASTIDKEFQQHLNRAVRDRLIRRSELVHKQWFNQLTDEIPYTNC